MSAPTRAGVEATAKALVGYHHAATHLRGMREQGIGVPWFLIGRVETEVRENVTHWGRLWSDDGPLDTEEVVDHARRWLAGEIPDDPQQRSLFDEENGEEGHGNEEG